MSLINFLEENHQDKQINILMVIFMYRNMRFQYILFILFLFIFCCPSVIAVIEVGEFDSTIPAIDINPILLYGLLDGHNIWTDINEFNALCLDSICINTWSDINSSLNFTGQYVKTSGDNMTGDLSVHASILADGSLDKETLYGTGNVRIGSYIDSGGYWGTSCYETNLTPIGGENSIWCIDNGGNDIRFYNPITSEVTMRIFDNRVRLGDSSNNRDLIVHGDINATTGTLYYDNYYAEGWFGGNGLSYDIEIGTTGYLYNLTNWTQGDYNGFGWSGYGVDVQHSGMYHLSGSITFTGGNNGEYGFVLMEDGVPQQDCATGATASSTTRINVGFSCFHSLQVSEHLTIAVRDTGSPPQDITIYKVNFNIHRIGNV